MTATSTSNHHRQAVNLALDYIHSHLNINLQLDTVAAIANSSPFHFHRIFKKEVGEPLDQYIRRLRLERAASMLQTFEVSLEELAYKTGYQSQQSLSKAFKKHFGESPSNYRNKSVHPLKRYERKQITNQEFTPMIQDMEVQHLVYLRIIGPYGKSLTYDDAWEKLLDHARQREFLTEETKYIGLSLDDPAITDSALCRFYACVTTKGKMKPEGSFGVLTLQPSTYAAFTLKGSYKQLYNLYQIIYFQWLPKSGYKLRSLLPFEKYLNSPDKVAQEELLTQIFIPIEQTNTFK